MKKMKDFSILIVISLICVCIVGGSVLAEDGEYNRRKRITSKGVIDYSNSTVVLDSSDLIYLADEIDDLERAYKSTTVEALNRIRTFYVSADGDISHERDDNNVPPDMAAELSFSDLYHGIIKSQSVDHLDNVQAEDADGNPLYYADQNAGDSNDLTSTTRDANDYPIFIQPASANNLTAGTAAWVDGDLIIGNGRDNTAYYDIGYDAGDSDGYDRGYDEGYDDGLREFPAVGNFDMKLAVTVGSYEYNSTRKYGGTFYVRVYREDGITKTEITSSLSPNPGAGTHWFAQDPSGNPNLHAEGASVQYFNAIE